MEFASKTANYVSLRGEEGKEGQVSPDRRVFGKQGETVADQPAGCYLSDCDPLVFVYVPTISLARWSAVSD